jgi:RNA polymerase sigma-70 factor (ECF subfamily)
MRRDTVRAQWEAAAARDLAGLAGSTEPEGPARSAELAGSGPDGDRDPVGADELALVFACCHPALDPAARVALTLRSVCGLPVAEIAAAFVVAEPTMAQRLVRAKRKIRQAGIPLTVPDHADMAARLDAVLRVVYLVYTQGHRAASGTQLVRTDLCDQAIRLARHLLVVLPQEPEVAGLLALLLLTDARAPARTGADGSLVLLADQDRSRWKHEQIAEGERLVQTALRSGPPGAYQLHAAIAACHSTAPAAEATDWREIAALYHELVRHEPTPIVFANQAVAIAMAEGPQAGLAILDRLAREGKLDRWPQLHIARAELLRQLDRGDDAASSYHLALAAGVPAAEEDFIRNRLTDLVTRS